MNKGLNYVLNNYESRYLTSEEEKELVKFSNSITFRLQVAEAVGNLEKDIASEVTKQMMEKFPDLDANFLDVKYKTYRDLVIIIRYCTNAMLRDDVEFLKTQMLSWLYTILKAFGFDKGSLSFCYEKVDEMYKEKLDSKHYRIIEPYFRSLIEVMNL